MDQIPTQLTEQIEKPLPPTKGTKTFLIIVIVLVAASVIGAGGYLLGSKYSTPKDSTVQPTITAPTSTPTTDPTAEWKTVNATSVTGESLSFKLPVGWGVIANMHLGTFIPIVKDEFISSANIIQIKESKEAKELIQVIFEKDQRPTITKTGENILFDQILSTFKFTE